MVKLFITSLLAVLANAVGIVFISEATSLQYQIIVISMVLYYDYDTNKTLQYLVYNCTGEDNE